MTAATEPEFLRLGYTPGEGAVVAFGPSVVVLGAGAADIAAAVFAALERGDDPLPLLTEQLAGRGAGAVIVRCSEAGFSVIRRGDDLALELAGSDGSAPLPEVGDGWFGGELAEVRGWSVQLGDAASAESHALIAGTAPCARVSWGEDARGEDAPGAAVEQPGEDALAAAVEQPIDDGPDDVARAEAPAEAATATETRAEDAPAEESPVTDAEASEASEASREYVPSDAPATVASPDDAPAGDAPEAPAGDAPEAPAGDAPEAPAEATSDAHLAAESPSMPPLPPLAMLPPLPPLATVSAEESAAGDAEPDAANEPEKQQWLAPPFGSSSATGDTEPDAASAPAPQQQWPAPPFGSDSAAAPEPAAAPAAPDPATASAASDPATASAASDPAAGFPQPAFGPEFSAPRPDEQRDADPAADDAFSAHDRLGAEVFHTPFPDASSFSRTHDDAPLEDAHKLDHGDARGDAPAFAPPFSAWRSLDTDMFREKQQLPEPEPGAARAAEPPRPPEFLTQPAHPGDAMAFTGPTPELLSNQGHRLFITGPIVVGRKPDATRAPDPQQAQVLKLSSPRGEVSRSHLIVTPHSGNVVVCDLGSSNGTVLARSAGEPEVLQAMVPVPLHAGDVLDLGDGCKLKLG